MMHITDGGYVKDEFGGTLGFVMKGLSRFYPEHGLFFSSQDLEEIARLMRDDDEWIEQENFTLDQSKGLVGLRVKTLGGLETTLNRLDSWDDRYSHAIGENGELLFVNHEGNSKHHKNIVAYRGPKL